MGRGLVAAVALVTAAGGACSGSATAGRPSSDRLGLEGVTSKPSLDPCVVGAQRAIRGDWSTMTTSVVSRTPLRVKFEALVFRNTWRDPDELGIHHYESPHAKRPRRSVIERLIPKGLAMELRADGQTRRFELDVEWRCRHDATTQTYGLEMRFERTVDGDLFRAFNLIETSSAAFILRRYIRPLDERGPWLWYGTVLGHRR